MVNVKLEEGIEINITYDPGLECTAERCDRSEFPEDPTQDGSFTSEDISTLLSRTSFLDMVHGSANLVKEAVELQTWALENACRKFGDKFNLSLKNSDFSVDVSDDEMISYVQTLTESPKEMRAFLDYVTGARGDNDLSYRVIEFLRQTEEGAKALHASLLNLSNEKLGRALYMLGKGENSVVNAGKILDSLASSRKGVGRFKKVYAEIAKKSPAMAARILLWAKTGENHRKTIENDAKYNRLMFDWAFKDGRGGNIDSVVMAGVYEAGIGNDVEEKKSDPIGAALIQDDIFKCLIEYLESDRSEEMEDVFRRKLDSMRQSGIFYNYDLSVNPQNDGIDAIAIYYAHPLPPAKRHGREASTGAGEIKLEGLEDWQDDDYIRLNVAIGDHPCTMVGDSKEGQAYKALCREILIKTLGFGDEDKAVYDLAREGKVPDVLAAAAEKLLDRELKSERPIGNKIRELYVAMERSDLADKHAQNEISFLLGAAKKSQFARYGFPIVIASHINDPFLRERTLNDIEKRINRERNEIDDYLLQQLVDELASARAEAGR